MTDLEAFLAFYRTRLGEDEARARDRLCVNCGGHTVPVESAIGITGYTHDGRMVNGHWEYGWQGKRCPGRLTGAEPVQDPKRVLHEVEAKRARLERYERAVNGELPQWQAGRELIGAGAAILLGVLRDDAAIWRDHPDYKPSWSPPA